ncbi:MAG: adenine phosphoribosyltransferase [Armatimonadota bacterium]|nr:adenine phosphoribosyltransferase [Armatimonadota bacterium]MCX7777559.1 adenine phosphoribosyltransferase [Armatimonadota bacterium]MDW8025568.1 adenine phosphoribosyltransferase [Armatimonadota bacterium]
MERVEVPELKEVIRTIPDFPKPGVLFRDITPILQKPNLFRGVIEAFANRYRDANVEVVTAVEARGFIFGAPLALELNAAFVPMRKKGKLPYKTISITYELEYGEDSIEMHIDAVQPGQRVLVFDDVLATGGTAQAMVRLVEMAGGNVVGVAFVIELVDLKGREKLTGYDVFSLVQL